LFPAFTNFQASLRLNSQYKPIKSVTIHDAFALLDRARLRVLATRIDLYLYSSWDIRVRTFVRTCVRAYLSMCV